MASPLVCPCMPALPEIPATSCSPGGRRGKDAMGGLAISSCQQERISRLRMEGKIEQIFCCRLLALMRGVARRLCTSLDFAKPTDL